MSRGPWLVLLLVATSACAGAPSAPATTLPASVAVATTTPATPTPTASAPPTQAPTATASAPATPAPSPLPTPGPARPGPATPAPTPAGAAAYCAVDDVLTPNRSYDAHARTYLDWTYAVGAAYVPPDLVTVSTGAAVRVTPFALPQLTAADLRALPGEAAYGALLVDDPNAAVRGVMLADLRALRSAATAAGRDLVVLSAYRSYAHQQATFDHWVRVGGYDQALRTSARPGHSEHQLGTAIDFGDGRAAPWEYRDWASTPSGGWLRDHAQEFGFVMSYPVGKSAVTCYDYEPWHYRWLGRSAALELASTGRTLREWQATLTR